MTARRTHIVGAGIAGLSAALATTEEGGEAVLYEAAPQAGGRCRTIRSANGFSHDNGTHVLLTANRNALSLLKSIGARDRWIEPERKGLPLYDLPTKVMHRVGLSPWSWLRPSRRPNGLGIADLLRLLRLAFPAQECSVASIIGDRPIMNSLIGPLTVAVLNTPPSTASARRLGCALRRLMWPRAGRLLVARNGLSEDLIQPAIETLQGRGVPLLAGQRLRNLLTNGERVIGLSLTDRTIALGPEDRVILALPPYEIERLLPAVPVPQRFEAILNVHFRLPGLDEPRFIGFTGGLTQWLLVRQDHVGVTISAADSAVLDSAADLAALVWREIAPTLGDLGLDASPDKQPEARVVKEKRATIRQDVTPLPQPPLRPLANLALAGDWIGSMPATIESAVISGTEAVAALLHTPLTGASASRHPALRREDAA
ncbi:hydroxysqualene dehydroxylase [Microvirga guangxiensis]|uniref:NAD-binding domain and a Fe-S cluster-containing protein n=1 Tax=Microvirga guangxiensis TaxID=549386 RepID=A0A1G5EF92_9HYPH|nr:FAD-dependent oxidoreductase [Microvirga guangxiensis]SCY25431.1 NAD-binding domain and a Fe-S cluster-containing protein [Microvirga guangxiensis]